MEGGENRTAFFKSFHVFIVVIRSLIFPASEENANPFNGQSANDGVVFFAFGRVVIEVIASPLAVADRKTGKFMKGLPVEFRAGHTKMNHLYRPLLFVTGANPQKL